MNNNNSVSSTFWDALKFCFRGEVIKISSYHKKQKDNLIDSLSKQIKSLQTAVTGRDS